MTIVLQYQNIPYPVNFHEKALHDISNGGLPAINFVEYSQKDIETALESSVVKTDINRLCFDFYKRTESQNLSEAVASMQVGAKEKLNINLTDKEAKALIAFHCSIGHEKLQGGYFRVTDILHGLSLGALQISDQGKSSTSITIERTDDGLVIKCIRPIKNIVNYENPNQINLMRIKYSFLMQENPSGSFMLQPIESRKNYKIETTFLLSYLLPRIVEFIKQDGVPFSEKLSHITPFLANKKVRDAFFNELVNYPVDAQLEAKEYIKLCHKQSTKVKNFVLQDFENALMKKFDRARYGLEKILNDNFIRLNEDKVLVQQKIMASTLITNINNLDNKIKQKNIILLTEVLDRTSLAILNPGDEKNFQQYENLIPRLSRKKMTNIAIAVAGVILGLVVIAAATLATVASFGATSALGAVGVALGASIILKAISIATGVLGVIGFVNGSLALKHHTKPEALSSLSKSMQSFWNASNRLKKQIDTRQLGALPNQNLHVVADTVVFKV